MVSGVQPWLLALALACLSWLDVATDCVALNEMARYAEDSARHSGATWTCSNATTLAAWNAGPSACPAAALNHVRAPRNNTVGVSSGGALVLKYALLPEGVPAVFPQVDYRVVYLAALGVGIAVLLANSAAQATLAAIHAARWGRQTKAPATPARLAGAALRGALLLELPYQTSRLCSSDAAQLRDAQAAVFRVRLAELVFKTPGTVLALFVFFIKILAQPHSLGLWPEYNAASAPDGGFSAWSVAALLLSVLTGVTSTTFFCTEYALSQHRSLWASAHATPAWYRALVAACLFCSVGARAGAIAGVCTAAVSAVGTGFYAYGVALPCAAGCLGLAWLAFVEWPPRSKARPANPAPPCGGGRMGSELDDDHPCSARGAVWRAGFQALVSSLVVALPWNTATAVWPYTRRRWWPAAAQQAAAAAALCVGAAVGVMVAATKLPCQRECDAGLLPAPSPAAPWSLQGDGRGPLIILALCLLSLAVVELVLFNVLCFAPRVAVHPRSACDDWDAVPDAALHHHDLVLAAARVVGTVLGSV